MNIGPEKTNFRADIDGLRAIAVFLVVAYHAKFELFSGGYIGVDIFFVISGYLITGKLLEEYNNSQTISFINFYIGRIRRLYPALITCLLITILLWGIFAIKNSLTTASFCKSIIYSLYGAANFFLANNSSDYFATTSFKIPLLHFWSLAVEEQFYLIWPVFIFFFLKYLPIHFCRTNNSNKIILPIFSFSLISFLYNLYTLYSERNLPLGFYLTPSRAWELSSGGLLFCFLKTDIFSKIKKNSFFSTYASSIISYLGILCIFFCTLTYKDSMLFPGFFAIPVVISTIFIITGGASNKINHVSKFISQKMFVYLGKRSYEIYLWHWPLFTLWRIHLMGEDISSLDYFILIFFTYILSEITYRFIEYPIRYGLFFKKLKSWQFFFAAVTASLFVLICSKQLIRLEEINSSKHTALYKQIEERSGFVENCHNQIELVGKKQCKFNLASNKNKSTIAIWGDSHASAQFPLFENFSNLKNAQIILYSRSANPPLINLNIRPHKIGKISQFNTSFNNSVIRSIKSEIKNHKDNFFSVALISRWQAYFPLEKISIHGGSDPFNCMEGAPETIETCLKIFREGLISTINQLKALGVHKIVIFTSFPEYRYEILDCYNESQKKCSTNLIQFQKYTAEIKNVILGLQKKYNFIKIVEPEIYFCNNIFCPQILEINDKKIPVVFDDNHPSANASRYLGTKIQSTLNWLIE